MVFPPCAASPLPGSLISTLFPSTHHSLLDDLQSASGPLRRQALDRFVEVYWKPAYKYVRVRWRREPADAEDLTQAFFLTLFERETFTRFEAARGSFHNFLRVCIDNFARDEAKSASSAKRGGGAARILSLDFPATEAELSAAPGQPDPEELFHREWQRQIFALAVADLEALCGATGKLLHLALFRDHDLAAEKPSYADLAARHGMPVTQVTNHLFWARRQLRRLALERIAGTTGSPGEFRTESRRLFEADP
jgi:RNA polymerase sigma factor (sigma-70 family)